MASTTGGNTNLYGMVDMGSNGIRFSITDTSPPTTRLMPIVYQDRAAISLYDAQVSHSEKSDVTTPGTRGSIPNDIMDEVVERLVRFQMVCDDFAVPKENIYVVATEATRTAANSGEFRARIKERTGWEVCLLSKEDEGRVGALGIASSSGSISGLAMDLGGGSTQITWLISRNGVVTTSPKGSFSFPYGAAALTKRLEEARRKGGKGEKELKEEMKRNFQDACRQLEIPEELTERRKESGRLDLYLCGGGFRGWGYVLMKQAEPYPISIINGFRVKKEDFHNTTSVLQEVSESETIFGVSKRRASQIPAVAVLVNVVMDALPTISHIQFCQGGVREGFLFDKLSPTIRAQDPLIAATLSYACPSTDKIRDLLLSALPTHPSPIKSYRTPLSISPEFIAALANLLFAHSSVPRESRTAAALHSTTTGLLASTNCLSHVDRALLALVLVERWAGDLAPGDLAYRHQLARCVSAEEAWWCQYLGRVAALIGDVYPAGRLSETNWRIQLETEWDSLVKKKGVICDLLRLRTKLNKGVAGTWLQARVEKIVKAGKKKNWIQDYGVRVEVTECT